MDNLNITSINESTDVQKINANETTRKIRYDMIYPDLKIKTILTIMDMFGISFAEYTCQRSMWYQKYLMKKNNY